MNFNYQILKSVRSSGNAARAILVVATLISGIATAKMMWLGSLDDNSIVRAGKMVLGLGLIEGSIAYTYHGIRKVFTNGIQRLVGYAFLAALVGAILCNLFTERMLSRGLAVNEFQQAWVDWAFDSVVVGVMLAIGAIQLFSDDARLERQALKQIGEDAEEKLREARDFPASLPESKEMIQGKDYRQ